MKRVFSIVFAVVMALNLAVVSNAEEEAWSNASGWALEELEMAKEKGIIPEILKGKDFTEQITREEFAEVSVKAYEALAEKTAETAEENPFTDTENPEILKAYSLGITKGITSNTFCPNNFLTREQAATMLSRAYIKAVELEEIPEVEVSAQFADDEAIGKWAKAAVYFMSANGVIDGVGNNRFSPAGSATREQAVAIAVRMCEKLAKTETTEPEPEQPTEDKKYDDEKEDFVLGFIGGSLTEGGASWQKKIKEVFEAKYPDKNIVVVNAGVSGTMSDYGVTRYKKDILSYNPDVVFIEFAVNDIYFEETEAKMYVEAMIRQSMKATKVPNIIFLYAPEPTDMDTDLYKRWVRGVEWKEEVVKHYGLKSVNIYDYMYNDYLKLKEEKGEEYNFTAYLETMYTRATSGEFDVHGGYTKYGEAIVKALTEEFDAYMKKPNDVTVMTDTKITNYRYEHIPATSGAMQYTAGWDTFTAGNNYAGENSAFTIPEKYFAFPYYTTGVKQTEKAKTAFGYYCSEDAEAVCVSYISSTSGATLKVTIDGVEAGSLTTSSSFQGMNYITSWISLPNDGKSHKVIFEVGISADGAGVCRFGSLIERFKR